MIFFCIGFPGRFTEWCDAVTSRLVQRALGSAEIVSLNTLEELAVAAITTDALHFVVCSRQPAPEVATALARANRRFIAVLDEPQGAVQDLNTRHGLDLVAATRTVASSCASLFGYIAIPGALVLSAARDGHDPVSTAAAIAHHLALTLSEADVVNIVETLKDGGVVPVRREDAGWWDRLAESERVLVDGSLAAYVDHFANGDFGEITWERELFYIHEEPPAQQLVPATRPVDITGRIRFLLYGPFIKLPPGSWSARVVLGFSPEAVGMPYVVEVFAGTQLTHVRVEPENERVVEVNLHFSIDESVDQPLQIRIINERAAFDGRLALGYVTLTPHASVRGDTRDYLTAVLSE